MLLETLLVLNPLPKRSEIPPENKVPPSRVILQPATREEIANCSDPLLDDKAFHTAVIKQNERITAQDWNQDVRHFELYFRDEIQ